MSKVFLLVQVILLIIIDQIIKRWIFLYRPYLIYENKGIFFGYVNNRILIVLMLILGLFALGYLLFNKNKTKRVLFFLIFITAGAFSNIVDRIIYGYVIDYFNFFKLNYFNLADIYILTGAILYIFYILRQK